MKPATTCLLLILLSLVASQSANAKSGGGSSGGGGREAFFRCRDSGGQTRFGDSMPAECMDVDTEVLSERGSVIRIIDGTKTLAEKAQRKSADDAARKEIADAGLRDRMLIDTYLSVADIERLRDQRIGLVEGQLQIDQQTLLSLKDRELRLLEQVKRFRPYSDKPNAQPIPANMVEDLVGAVNSRRVTEDRLTEKRAEQQDLQAKFTSDIKRFRELKGLK